MSVVLATAGFDHKIRFWEAPSGVCSRVIKFPDSQVNRLEITPDKQFIAAAGNPVIRLYEILPATGGGGGGAAGTSSATTTTAGTSAGSGTGAAPGQQTTQQQHQQQQQQQQVMNGVMADSAPPQQPALTLEGHTSNVTSIGFQKDGRYLYSGSEDGTIKVWDLRKPNYSRSFDSGSGVNSVALRQDRDEIVSGDQNGNVKVWDIGGSGCINSVRPSAAGTNHSFPSRCNTAASHQGGASPPQSSSPQQQQTQNQNHHHQQQHHHNYNYRHSEASVPIQAVDISEDSRTLVAVSNHGTVFVWDPSSGHGVLPRIDGTSNGNNAGGGGGGGGGGVNEADGNALNGVAMEHDPSASANLLRPITKFRAHAPGAYCLHARIAPDCRHVVTTSSDGTAKLWDTATWELTQTLQAGFSTSSQPAQPPLPSVVAMSSGGGAGGIRRVGGNQRTTATSTAATVTTTTRKKWVWDAAFCADSSYLVTASSDNVARLWNLRTGDVVRQYHGHQSAVTCVALNDSSV